MMIDAGIGLKTQVMAVRLLRMTPMGPHRLYRLLCLGMETINS